jgi:hypothetical protein
MMLDGETGNGDTGWSSQEGGYRPAPAAERRSY